jgi:hypothetical protein
MIGMQSSLDRILSAAQSQSYGGQHQGTLGACLPGPVEMTLDLCCATGMMHTDMREGKALSLAPKRDHSRHFRDSLHQLVHVQDQSIGVSDKSLASQICNLWHCAQ